MPGYSPASRRPCRADSMDRPSISRSPTPSELRLASKRSISMRQSRAYLSAIPPAQAPLSLRRKPAPNSDNWKPDPSIMLRQSVLSAVTDQRQSLMAGLGKADQVKLDQYFTSVRDMEKQLAIQLQKPEKCQACVVPPVPKESPRSASVDAVNANAKTMARLLAMGLACNQSRVFTFVHTAGASETYITGQSKIYHQITHDEPTDAQL